VFLAAFSPIANSKGDSYTPPTAEEMAPMRPEYLAELAKIHEPPEMSGKPMEVRNVVSTKQPDFQMMKMSDQVFTPCIRSPMGQVIFST